MSQQLLAAHTPHTSYRCYPPYFNASIEGDEVVLTVRAHEKLTEGSHVCGFAKDAGQLGRCTPGDDRCNNYCNMAPQKGPMQDHPMAWPGARCGETSTMRMPLTEWRKLLREMVLATEAIP